MFYSNLFNLEYKKTFPFVKISKTNFLSILLISIFIGIMAFIMETMLDYIAEYNIYDRGFLIGPFIPLYFFVIFFMLTYIKTPSYTLASFIKSIIIIAFFVSLIEYIVGNICERLFDVTLWYYEESLPLSYGYFSITIGLIWGLLGSVFLFFITPLLKILIDKLTINFKLAIVTIFIIFFLSDLLITLKLISINNGYKELFRPIKGSITTSLLLIVFIMFILTVFSYLILLNIKRKNIFLYIVFYISLIFPMTSLINYFINKQNLFIYIFSYIGYLIILFYMTLLLLYTIKKLIKLKK